MSFTERLFFAAIKLHEKSAFRMKPCGRCIVGFAPDADALRKRSDDDPFAPILAEIRAMPCTVQWPDMQTSTRLGECFPDADDPDMIAAFLALTDDKPYRGGGGASPVYTILPSEKRSGSATGRAPSP